MMRLPLFLAALGALLVCLGGWSPGQAQAIGDAPVRAIVYAEEPHDLSVTIYRDPERREDEPMESDDPGGFAMISETRQVTLPAGESTIRFDGVAEGMIGVSAIVTGLPGGTIEKNRNAELLSPAALVNGTLGNRVTITRTNPATGEAVSEQAIVRTRADGGLVLQTGEGFEAVRCAGVPETLVFDGVPDGLSARPVFSIDTRDETGGTYEITLTYLAWGFDWQANYIATLKEKSGSDSFEMGMLSWLTVLNDNAQSFANAQLLVVAGELNLEQDYAYLTSPPTGEPLRLNCYPFGSTAAGSPIVLPARPLRLGQYDYSYEDADGSPIVVTARRRSESLMDLAAPVASVSAEALEAREENLGDLKLYRVPERMTVAAQGIKQVAFLNRDEVEARYVYEIRCSARSLIRSQAAVQIQPASIQLLTKNDEDRGLGVALPQGPFNLFEPSAYGPLLVNVNALRDYAVGEEIELDVGQSQHVTARCNVEARKREDEGQDNLPRSINALLTNANDHVVKARLILGRAGAWTVDWPYGDIEIKDGQLTAELDLLPQSERSLRWSAQALD